MQPLHGPHLPDIGPSHRMDDETLRRMAEITDELIGERAQPATPRREAAEAGPVVDHDKIELQAELDGIVDGPMPAHVDNSQVRQELNLLMDATRGLNPEVAEDAAIADEMQHLQTPPPSTEQ